VRRDEPSARRSLRSRWLCPAGMHRGACAPGRARSAPRPGRRPPGSPPPRPAPAAAPPAGAPARGARGHRFPAIPVYGRPVANLLSPGVWPSPTAIQTDMQASNGDWPHMVITALWHGQSPHLHTLPERHEPLGVLCSRSTLTLQATHLLVTRPGCLPPQPRDRLVERSLAPAPPGDCRRPRAAQPAPARPRRERPPPRPPPPPAQTRGSRAPAPPPPPAHPQGWRQGCRPCRRRLSLTSRPGPTSPRPWPCSLQCCQAVWVAAWRGAAACRAAGARRPRPCTLPLRSGLRAVTVCRARCAWHSRHAAAQLCSRRTAAAAAAAAVYSRAAIGGSKAGRLGRPRPVIPEQLKQGDAPSRLCTTANGA